jgi:large conductance mechanosensitive channel
MLKGFKEFILRGNVVDLAVAFVLGAAFAAVVISIVDNLINPLIAAIFGKPDISKVLTFEINEAVFSIGAILQAALNFLFIAAAVYFVIVMPLNKLAERRARGVEPAPEELTTDQQLLTEIRDSLRTRP